MFEHSDVFKQSYPTLIIFKQIYSIIGWLVKFYDISTIIADLMPNSLYTKIWNIWSGNTLCS